MSDDVTPTNAVLNDKTKKRDCVFFKLMMVSWIVRESALKSHKRLCNHYKNQASLFKTNESVGLRFIKLWNVNNTNTL